VVASAGCGEPVLDTEDGQVWPSPSRAAVSAAKVPSYDGWHAWRVARLAGLKLDRLRDQLIAQDMHAAALPDSALDDDDL